MGFKYFLILIVLLAAYSVESRCWRKYRVFNRRAVVNIDGPSAKGRLIFQEVSCGRRVRIYGTITNLTPGKHGMHVHEFGDTANNCAAAGAHYNPFRRNHGAPTDSIKRRHVGDLGNIFANKKGVARVRIVDRIIRIRGRRNIIGRAIVVHAQRDDLGRGGNAESLRTGNAGARVGCGVIGALSK